MHNVIVCGLIVVAKWNLRMHQSSRGARPSNIRPAMCMVEGSSQRPDTSGSKDGPFCKHSASQVSVIVTERFIARSPGEALGDSRPEAECFADLKGGLGIGEEAMECVALPDKVEPKGCPPLGAPSMSPVQTG
ncbi:hypothetical protein NDU88_004295 [Pleurodeles waltl]|uniref:Uncharacterized protein n=1 Tax=Pleurodeles waltl TaxID=8319 RepID=A0AAV7M765_PLEWA|nr:hypothetical protein NDU88_004295 [Pleurodeles waltl]